VLDVLRQVSSRILKGTTNDVRVDSEQHAVGLSISETLALRISLACGAASGEGVLGAGAVKVVSSGVLRVANQSAARCPKLC
jgi:hypothetical protein